MKAAASKRIILGMALLAWASPGMQAQGKLPTISTFELGYSIRSWTMNDGLKGPYIGGFVQSRDGTLLFSDSAGLIRYNGIAFEDLIETAPPEVPRLNILAIHEDPDGRLWTAGLNGQAMREADGRWVAIGKDRGGHSGVGKFAVDPDGRLWCAVSMGAGLIVSIWEDDRFQPVTEKPLRSGYVQEMEFDPAGQLWLSVAAQGPGPSVYRLERDTLVPEEAADLRVSVLFRKTGDPRLWLATRTGIRVRENHAWRDVVAFSEELPERNGFSACAVDEQGNYWLATRSLAVWVCRPDGRVGRLISEEVKLPNLIRDLFSGRDGTIWFNGENGLLQLRRRPFTLWPQSQRHRRTPIRAMAEDGEGTLWFGGIGIYSMRPGEFVRPHWQDDTEIPSVYGILGNSEGGAWFPARGNSLNAISSTAQRSVARLPQNSGAVVDLAFHEGEIWYGLRRNLLRLQEGTLKPDLPEGVGQDFLECLAAGPEGKLYAGFRTKGLFSHKDGKWNFAGLEGRVEALALAPDKTLWARRGGSELCWFRNGEWRRANGVEMGIPPQFHMVCSREGSIWFQGLRGPVIRIDRKAAEAWLQGDRNVDLRLRSYGQAEGLAAEQAPYGPRKRTLMEDSRGRIWVATVLGTCAWDPSYDTFSTTETVREEPMPVVIEKVYVDGQPVPGLNGVLTVTPDKHRLEIHYVGLDLANPEAVRYRYRIEGYQDEWADAGSRHAAYFQRIPPGSYRFQVIAADRHGLWNEAGATLAITVLPHWWEHWSFRYGTPAGLLFLLLGWTYLRIQSFRRRSLERARLQDEFSRGLIEAQESERARIAGELHDDVGQDLIVLKSRIDLCRRHTASNTEAESLRQLSESAADVLHKMRGLSHQLRPLHLDHLGLSTCVSSLVKEVAEASQLKFEVEADDLEGKLSPECEVAVYRMLQESLNNVVKHAQASSVKVELHRQERSMTLTIQDDGRGFHPEKPKPGGRHIGHGLHAMKERCSLVGGCMMVDSTPGAGTLILIEVPFSKAPED